MATTYKILGQIQASAASGIQNLNLFPDPNFERYTSDTTHSNPGTGTIWEQYNQHDSNTQTNYLLNGGQTTATSGRTNVVRFSNHNGSSSKPAYWRLAASKRPYLDASKTYTLSMWYYLSNDSNGHYTGNGHGGHNVVYTKDNGANFTTLAENHYTGNPNNDGNYYYNNWVQHYTTFNGTNSYFYPQVHLNQGNSSFWQYMHMDNIYLSEGSIPRTLIPSKAPDGSTGNPNAIHAEPFTTRSEGWSATAYESPTIRKLTGSWQTLYQVPDILDASAVISTLTITNTSSTSASYRIAIVKNGEQINAKHIVAFDIILAPNALETQTLGLTIGRQDRVLVQSDSDKVSFSLFGSENQP